MAGSRFSLESILSLTDNATVTMNRMAGNATALSKHMHKHVGGMSQLWKKFGGVVTGALAAISLGVVTKAITDFAAKGDDISDVSKRLMIGAEALQEFQYAAHAADITSEDLTGMLQKMNNNMGQLGQGTGALFTYLKKANPQLALQLLHTKDSETAFTTLMDAIAKESDVQKRATLAQAAFGRSGQQIIDMAGDLNAKRAEARRLGLIMSQADINAAAEMHANLLRLKASAGAFFNVIMARATRALLPLLEKFNAWIEANRELIGQKIERVINFIAKAATTVYNIFKKWGWVILAVVGAFTALKVISEVSAALAILRPLIIVANAAMLMLANGASLATVAQWALNAAMDANPVGAVIIVMMALIIVVVLIIKYWRQITDALREAWNWLNKLFSNPWIANALYFIASPIFLIIGAVRTLVDLLSGKRWRSFENLIPPWMKGIGKAFGYQEQGGAGKWTEPGGGQTTGFGALRGVERAGYANPATPTAESKLFQEIVKKMSVNLTVPKGFGLQADDGSAFPDTSMDFGEQ